MNLKIPGKSIFESRIPDFCYIQVILLTLAIYGGSSLDLASPQPWKNVKNAFPIFHIFLWTKLIMVEVKNYNLNVTEVRYPAFPMLFPGIFNFPVGILSYICIYNQEQLSCPWNNVILSIVHQIELGK